MPAKVLTVDERQAIEAVMVSFRFDRVHVAMTALNWKWYKHMTVPTVEELKKEARRLMEDIFDSEETTTCYRGGFRVTKPIYNEGDGPERHLRLSFEVESYAAFVEDVKL